MASKITYLLCRHETVRKFVRFMERNHLTRRTADDIFYHTRPTFKCIEQDSVLSCLAPSRVPVRPKNFLRKLFFDLKNYEEPEIIRLESNMAVRNNFRNIREQDIFNNLEHMAVAPANQHGRIAASRNAASNFLSTKEWGDRNHVFTRFSLSGSKQEIRACGFGYRGRHQATDYAQESRRDRVLQPPPELCSMQHHRNWVVISTDTTNHLPPEDKSALLGNGIPIVSYSPTAMSEMGEALDRSTHWDGNSMVTCVNGGGDYRDLISNTNLDVEYVDCPDGSLMMVYVDCFRDPFDRTHSYICETPFARIARGTRSYDDFKDKPRAQPLAPYTITNTKQQTFSCIAIRHNDLIQIVDNDARKTFFYSRAELLELDGMEVGMKAKFRIQEKSPTIYGQKQDDKLRFEVLKRLGFNNLHLLCKHCPSMNMTMPTRQNRRAYIAEAAIAAARTKDDFTKLLSDNPGYKDYILNILDTLGLDYVLPPPELPEVREENLPAATQTP